MLLNCPVCLKNTFDVTAQPGRCCRACGYVRLPETSEIQGPLDADLPTWIQDILSEALRGAGRAELLEIGCGSGVRLKLADKLGFSVMGVEASAPLRNRARQLLPGRFIAESLEHLPPHGFDFVLLTGVLERAPDPYVPFYSLFGKGVITERTTVLVDMTVRGVDASVRNIFSTSALAVLFRMTNFQHCEIAEVPEADGSVHLHCVARGSHFSSFMQERYVPGTWSELTDYEHLPRYEYASHLATGGNVLDFGCGTGYGARRLAAAALNVLAVDIDEVALDYARSGHDMDNLQFLRNADLGDSLEAEQFNLITCFEVIEHISAEQQGELMKNLAKLLKPEGVLLISTPNPTVTALYGENPYHLHEMKLEEFRTLVSSAFPHVQMLLQNISASVFLQTEDLSEHAELVCDRKLFQGDFNNAIYIAACAKKKLPDLPSVVYPDKGRNFIAGHVDMQRQRSLLSLERLKLVQRERENTILRDQLAAELELKRLTVQREMENTDLRNQLAAELELKHLMVQREMENTVLRDELTAAKNRLTARVRDAEARSAHLTQQLLAAQDEQNALTTQLRQIHDSSSWRALRRIQPLLAELRPVLRPPLRLAYRAWRRLKGRSLAPTPLAGPVDPTSHPRNLPLEFRLEPVWNEAAGHYQLEYDMSARVHRPGGWVEPYHVVPFHQDGPAQKRILHIIPNVFVGGSTQLVIDLVQKLPRPYEHEILTSALWPGGVHTGVGIHQVQAADPLAMARLMDEVRPDMIHVHYWGLTDESWYQAALEAIRGCGVPAVQNVNTPIAPLVDPVFGSYVFVSQYVLDCFGGQAAASGAAVRVIHPGIDLSLFEGQESVPDAENAIGMVYRLERDKLNEDSIALLIEVVKRRPRTRAYVVGGGSLLQPYLERTEQAGVRENFRFSGYVPYESLPKWYEKFRLFVAPVWKESFGQVAPFAMSKGCVVAGYDIGALAEIAGGHETLGHDLGEVAGIIVNLLDDPPRLRRMGEENHLRAGKLFGLEKMIERYTEVYDLMLAG